MKHHTVSLSIAWDWEAKPASPDDASLMNDVRKLFAALSVDTYGREADDNMKVWILRGETIWNLRSFTQQLTDLLPSFDIVYMCHTQKRS